MTRARGEKEATLDQGDFPDCQARTLKLLWSKNLELRACQVREERRGTGASLEKMVRRGNEETPDLLAPWAQRVRRVKLVLLDFLETGDLPDLREFLA